MSFQDKPTKEIILKARVDQAYYNETIQPLLDSTGLNVSELIRALIDAAKTEEVTVTKNVVTVDIGKQFGKRQKTERPL